MKRLFQRVLLTSVFVAFAAGAASAAVHIRIAVSPDSIPQCSRGQFFIALNNDGTMPILAHVCISLTRNDSTLFGPVCARVPLAAGETRSHEFMFPIPLRTPIGDYAFV